MDNIKENEILREEKERLTKENEILRKKLNKAYMDAVYGFNTKKNEIVNLKNTLRYIYEYKGTIITNISEDDITLRDISLQDFFAYISKKVDILE